MVDYFIYTKDCSNSTNGADYHCNVLKTIEQFKCDVKKIEEQLVAEESPRQSKIVYLHWGDDCWDVEESETTKSSVDVICQRKDRDPGCITRHLQRKYTIGENDKIKLLYIITNGMIDRKSIDDFFGLNNSMHYETVVFHAFNGDPEKIDLSVAAPFFKSRCMVYRNGELCDSTDIFKELDYEKINDKNYAANKHRLESYIKLKYSNEFYREDIIALQDIIKLIELRNRLFLEFETNRPKYPFFNRNLTVQQRNHLMFTFDRDAYERGVFRNHKMSNDVSKLVAALIKYIEGDEQPESDVVKSDDEEESDDSDFTDDEDESFDFALDE